MELSNNSGLQPKAIVTRDLDGCPFTVAVLRLFETHADVLYLDDGAVEEKVPLEELEVDCNHAPWTQALQERWSKALMELGGENAVPEQPTPEMPAAEKPMEAVSEDDAASNSKEGLSREEEYEDDYEDDAEDDGDGDDDTDDDGNDKRCSRSCSDLDDPSDISSDEADGPEAPEEADVHSPAGSDQGRCPSASTADSTAGILNVTDGYHHTQSEHKKQGNLSDTSSDEGDGPETQKELCVCSPVGSDQPRCHPASTPDSTANAADAVLDVSSDEEDEQELEEILSQLSDDDVAVDDCMAVESGNAQTHKQDGADVGSVSEVRENVSLASNDHAPQEQKSSDLVIDQQQDMESAECASRVSPDQEQSVVHTSSPGEVTAEATEVTSGISSGTGDDAATGPSSNLPENSDGEEQGNDSDAKLHSADAASDSDDAGPSTRASDADADIVDSASRCSSEKSSPYLEEDADDTPKASRPILSPEDRALRLAYLEEAFAELPRRYEIFVHYGTHGNFDCQ
eukprot:TRINITY_DN88844_c0_g1_i1.p1 TRINITY_DN88844_c0_g1~~TRINITY_DN88844_c0_g1_i1.p1  ORF type:complete len:515 (-),score=128.18 TRINITY_DN88844_c0_g1_i1:231-1775(-)